MSVRGLFLFPVKSYPPGTLVQRVLRTGIYVNLLPEGDALRVKQGLRLPSETELRQLLEDLGG